MHSPNIIFPQHLLIVRMIILSVIITKVKTATIKHNSEGSKEPLLDVNKNNDTLSRIAITVKPTKRNRNLPEEEDTKIGMGISRNGSGCASKFMVGAMSKSITDKCVELIGMRMENFPRKKEDLIKINYDDMCFSKCYLMEINYLTEKDTFDRAGIINSIRKETPQDKWNLNIQAANKCIKYTEDMASEEGGVANSPCKYALIFFMCQREIDAKLGC